MFYKIAMIQSNRNFIHFFILVFALWLPSLLHGEKSVKPEDQVNIGNFVLPVSQQPGPLVSFGQNIIDKGVLQLYTLTYAYVGPKNSTTVVMPGFLYGITDYFSLFANAPCSVGNRYQNHHSKGIQDVFAQLECAYFTQRNVDSVDQATILANVSFPTGSTHKNPPTGYGSYAFFFGTTYNHTGVYWFYYTSTGFQLPLSHHGTQFGEQFLYQCGVGRNIPSPKGWLFAGMIELDGTYSWKNSVHGRIDPNSGGNAIYITPSLWISSDRLILEFGAGYPVLQHLFGNQSKIDFSLLLNLGVTL